MLPLRYNSELAELVGIFLGDGCLTNVSRTERFLISLDSRSPDQINYVSSLINKVFEIIPKIEKQKGKNCIRVLFYRKGVAKAIGFPIGNKIKNNLGIPDWIKQNNSFLKFCLRDLFETDGSCYEQPHNYTFVLDFTNRCKNLLQDDYEGLITLGYNPQKHSDYVRLARKAEAKKFIREINFRDFNCRVV